MSLLDAGDLQILRIIQEDCRLTAREISNSTGIPVTTVFAKIRRMERMGIIKHYRAILDSAKLEAGTTAFVLGSFAYRTEGGKILSQKEVAKQIAQFPEVQEVHIISGDWDILMKVKAKDVESVGRFVVDKLRLVKGIEKTLTCLVFESQKETTAIPL
jgi:Lrp/AsnC family leucine-responsive transcriptional regulator